MSEYDTEKAIRMADLRDAVVKAAVAEVARLDGMASFLPEAHTTQDDLRDAIHAMQAEREKT